MAFFLSVRILRRNERQTSLQKLAGHPERAGRADDGGEVRWGLRRTGTARLLQIPRRVVACGLRRLRSARIVLSVVPFQNSLITNRLESKVRLRTGRFGEIAGPDVTQMLTLSWKKSRQELPPVDFLEAI